MSDNTLEVLLKLKDEMSARLKDIEGSLGGLTGATNKQLTAFDKMKETAGGVILGNMVGQLVSATRALGDNTVEIVKMYGKYESVRDSFRTMSNGLIANIDSFQNKVASASKGTIDNFTILQNATRALSMIGKDSFNDFETDFTKMAELSKKAARATGQDVDFMFSSLITGVSRSSKLILDNLGINVSLEESYERFAQKAGKASSQLSDQEKKTALLNEAVRQLEKNYGDVAVSAGGVQGKFQQMDTIMKNLNMEYGKLLTPVAIQFFQLLLPLLQGVNNTIVSLQQRVGLLSKDFENLGNFAKKNETALTVLTIVFGTLTTAILAYNAASIATMVSNGIFIFQFYAYTAATTLATIATTGFGVAIAFLTSPITLIILAIGLLVGAVYLLWRNWDWVRQQAGILWPMITAYVSTAVTSILTFLGILVGGAVALFTELLNNITAIWTSLWDYVIATYNAFVAMITSAISAYIADIVARWESFKTQVSEVATAMWKNLTTAWTNILASARSTWEGIANAIIEPIKRIIDWVGQAIGKINELINNAKKIGGDALKKIGVNMSFADGGTVPYTGMAKVHAGEYVLSRDMLAGRQPISAPIANNMNNNNKSVVINATINTPVDLNLLGYQLGLAIRN